MYTVYSEEYKGFTIDIFPDSNCDSPRDWDNVGHMVCFHSRYNLGDRQPDCSPEEFIRELAEEIPGVSERLEYWENDGYNRGDSEGRVEKIIEETIERYYIILDLYLYDHGGITMNTGGFSCPWDSGQVGYIYMTKAEAVKEYGKKKATKKVIEKAVRSLEAEVSTYDDYIRGNVYGYRVSKPLPDCPECGCTPEPEEVDSCWGYIGDYDGEDGALSEARSFVDWKVNHKEG